MASMKGLTFPDGSPAYTLCENVQTGAGTIDTACTPIQFVTGAANDNADLTRVFGAATEADFMPHQSGFARFWKSMKVATKNAASSAFDAADRVGEVGLGPDVKARDHIAAVSDDWRHLIQVGSSTHPTGI